MMSFDETFAIMRRDVSVLFWPVLYLSLKGFIAFMREHGAKGHRRLNYRVSWYGRITITWLDKPDPFWQLREIDSWERLVHAGTASPWRALAVREHLRSFLRKLGSLTRCDQVGARAEMSRVYLDPG